MRTRVQRLKKMSDTKPHLGRRIALIRGVRNLTQKELADLTAYSQQTISDMEKKELLTDDELRELTNGLGVTPEFVKEMKEENLGTMVFHTHDHSQGYIHNNINPLEHLLKQMEEIKQLYEKLLQSEKEKVVLLEQTLDSLRK